MYHGFNSEICAARQDYEATKRTLRLYQGPWTSSRVNFRLPHADDNPGCIFANSELKGDMNIVSH